MNIGDTITCSDEDDLIETMDDLSRAGYGTVRMAPYSSYMIRITSVPEKEG